MQKVCQISRRYLHSFVSYRDISGVNLTFDSVKRGLKVSRTRIHEKENAWEFNSNTWGRLRNFVFYERIVRLLRPVQCI